jgi:hypothetical protein
MTRKEGSTDYWFKPRRYGHGATPSTWQGWAATAAFPLVCALAALVLIGALPDWWGVIAFAIFMTAATLAFIAFVRKKTDGEWRWRWGEE